MGGRGSSSGKASSGAELELKQSKTMIDNENGWDYRGISERLDKLESALKNARSNNKVADIFRIANATDALIGAEIERLHNNTADVPGNENALLTQRRRVRSLLKNIKNRK